MSKLLVKNGFVIDPINEINGDKTDILIEDGKIVEQFTSNKDVKEIDANNMTVIPSGIDIHSHFASQQMNWLRLLGSDNKHFIEYWERLTLDSIAKNYIKNGYTFIIEANVFPSLAKQTIFDFINLPVLDKGMLLNIGNLWPLESEIQNNNISDTSLFLSDLLSKTKGFGFKVYNPFEAEAWNFSELRESIQKGGKLYNFSALDVYKHYIEAIEKLNPPHSIHAHIEGYESNIGTNNLSYILEMLKDLGNQNKNNSDRRRNQIFHIAHANSYNIDNGNSDFIDYINNNQFIDLDLGFIGFDKINPLVTSDRKLIYQLKNQNDDNNIFTSSIESEGDSFSTFRKFEKSNQKDCKLWGNALELALKVNNKFQLQFSLNFPNYSNLNNIPKIASLLLSSKSRQDYMKDLNKDFSSRNYLSNQDKLSFYDYVTITRASPAKSLGISHIKGSFTPASDGDLNIISINLDQLDFNKDYEKIEKSLENMIYVVKNGEIIKKDNKFSLSSIGNIFWTEGKVDIDKRMNYIQKKKEFYQKYYSIFYESLNNPVDINFLRKI